MGANRMSHIEKTVKCQRATRRWRGFTLIELLVCVGIIALLLSILLPALAQARNGARSLKCLANLQQMGIAWRYYATDHNDLAMPLGYYAGSSQVLWWGQIVGNRVDHTKGFLWPYLSAELQEGDILQCPAQPWGTYSAPSSVSECITSTYGYNGYYLSPSQTPGWSPQINHRPWQKLDMMPTPSELFVFADTLIEHYPQAKVTAYLDPPMTYSRGGFWRRNDHPTTAFRHSDATNALCADGHAQRYSASKGVIVSQTYNIGYVGQGNGPHYVPDYWQW